MDLISRLLAESRLFWGGLCNVVPIASRAWLQHRRPLFALFLSLGQSKHASHLVEVKDGNRAQVTACPIPTSALRPTPGEGGSDKQSVIPR